MCEIVKNLRPSKAPKKATDTPLFSASFQPQEGKVLTRVRAPSASPLPDMKHRNHLHPARAALPPAPAVRRVCQAWVAALGFACLGLLSHPASATPPSNASAQHINQWTAQAQQWIDQQLATAADTGSSDMPRLRPEVLFGQMDPRLRLDPCQQVEPFLPGGTRLWGRSRIGLRCVQGPTPWSVFIPVTVKVWGPGWVIQRPVAPGDTLTQEDAQAAEIDWTESAATVLAQPQDWVGAQASRALMPGQALREGMVKPPQAFAAGSQVKVLVRGQGFALTATGEALTHGYLGQTARVRMPNRKVVTGTVRNADTVEVLR